MNRLQILQDAMALTLQARAAGHHLFVEYEPNTDSLDMELFLGGYTGNDDDTDFYKRVLFDGRLGDPVDVYENAKSRIQVML